MPPAHIYDNYYLMSSHFYSEWQKSRLWEWLKHGGDKKPKSFLLSSSAWFLWGQVESQASM